MVLSTILDWGAGKLFDTALDGLLGGSEDRSQEVLDKLDGLSKQIDNLSKQIKDDILGVHQALVGTVTTDIKADYDRYTSALRFMLKNGEEKGRPAVTRRGLEISESIYNNLAKLHTALVGEGRSDGLLVKLNESIAGKARNFVGHVATMIDIHTFYVLPMMQGVFIMKQLVLDPNVPFGDGDALIEKVRMWHEQQWHLLKWEIIGVSVYNLAIDIMRDPRDAYQTAFCSRYSSESGQQHFKPLVIRPPEGIAAIEALVPTRTYVTVNGPTDQLVEEEKWWQLEPVQERPSSWNLDTKYQFRIRHRSSRGLMITEGDNAAVLTLSNNDARTGDWTITSPPNSEAFCLQWSANTSTSGGQLFYITFKETKEQDKKWLCNYADQGSGLADWPHLQMQGAKIVLLMNDHWALESPSRYFQMYRPQD